MCVAPCDLPSWPQYAACQLTAKVWDTLLRSGYSPEEVLLHMASGSGGAPGAGPGAELPPLHAAVASASPQAVSQRAICFLPCNSFQNEQLCHAPKGQQPQHPASLLAYATNTVHA